MIRLRTSRLGPHPSRNVLHGRSTTWPRSSSVASSSNRRENYAPPNADRLDPRVMRSTQRNTVRCVVAAALAQSLDVMRLQAPCASHFASRAVLDCLALPACPAKHSQPEALLCAAATSGCLAHWLMAAAVRAARQDAARDPAAQQPRQPDSPSAASMKSAESSGSAWTYVRRASMPRARGPDARRSWPGEYPFST
jgi:hypothetical protein